LAGFRLALQNALALNLACRVPGFAVFFHASVINQPSRGAIDAVGIGLGIEYMLDKERKSADSS
jgi:hypothetical protein